MPDCHKYALAGNFRNFARLYVFGDNSAAHSLVVRKNFLDDAIPNGGDFLVFENSLAHNFRRPELVAAVYYFYRRTKTGKEHRLFASRVSAADNDDILVAVECAVASGARGNAPSAVEFGLALCAGHFGRGACGYYDFLCLVDFAVGRKKLFYVAGKIDLFDNRILDARAELLRLLAHFPNELETVDGFGKAGEIFDIACRGKKSPRLRAFKDEWVHAGASRINCGAHAGAAASDYNNFFHIFYEFKCKFAPGARKY